MSVVGRFEILSPVFAGAVDTSTARDPQSGETVLLHLLPAGREDSPREYFLELAPGCPGQILDHGVDAETKRAFVVTDYPKDRKAVRLWIKEMIGIGTPTKPLKPVTARQPSPMLLAQPLVPAPPPPLKEAAPFADRVVAFTGEAVAAKLPNAPSDGATRMFDPAAVFGAPAESSSAPAQDGATRMFDPGAVFGGTAAPKPLAAPKASSAPASDGATRMFDPSAMFAASAATPQPPAKEQISDSSKRAADDFIHGRLPAEFRNAPLQVQRSMEELLGTKGEDKGRDVQPTPGRPGVITLLFDAYGKRVEHAEDASAARAEGATESNAGATKVISSADLSSFFTPGPSADPDNKEGRSSPPQDSPTENK